MAARKRLREKLGSERGAELMEYVLVVIIIFIVYEAFKSLGETISDKVKEAETKVKGK